MIMANAARRYVITVDLNDLPLNVRSALAPYDANHDGRINDADLAGILAGLNRTPDGSVNLDTLPAPHPNKAQ